MLLFELTGELIDIESVTPKEKDFIWNEEYRSEY